MEKSRIRTKSTSKLTWNGYNLAWEHLRDAFDNDQTQAIPVYRKLRPHHFQLTSKLKMRNSLANDVLDKNMLNLMHVSRPLLHICCKSKEINLQKKISQS